MKRILIFFCLTSLVLAQKPVDGSRYKPIEYDTSYNHTKYAVEPIDQLFKLRAYTTSFDGKDDNNGDGIEDTWGIPEWVSFEVKKKTIKIEAKRPSKWLSEDNLYDDGIAPDDDTYKVTKAAKEVNPYSLTYNLSRGHMCPKNTANRLGANADYNTHSVLNACPQYQWHNNGIWKDLERLIENWTDHYEQLWVICGPIIFENTPQMWLGENGEKKIAVPDAFYKIIIREVENDSLAIMAFIYPHAIEQSDNQQKGKKGYPHEKFLVSIDEVERLTGLNFFANLSEERQNVLEKAKAEEIWDDPGEYDLLGN